MAPRTNYLARGIGCAAALVPFALAAASLVVGPPEVRLPVLVYLTVGVGLTFTLLAVLVTLANAHLCFLRPYLFRRRHGSYDGMRNISGFPLAGTFFAVLGCLFAFGHRPIAVVTLFVLVLDVGGLPWAVATVWRDRGFWNDRPP
jgi:hypothetical protein